MLKKILNKVKLLIQLGRYNYPTGAFLLMWPCFWGVLYELQLTEQVISTLLLFFFGSFVMRGAGCCINDIFDKNIDKSVKRTKNRPLASEKLKVSEALIFVFFQLFIGLLIVLQFDFKVILFSFYIIPLVIIYPLFKRFTYFPQIILGIIFNWGILVGYLTQNFYLNPSVICLYLGGLFLTVAYDTIYGFQDLKDDRKIGVKSLSLKLEKKSKFYILSIFLLSLFFFFLSFIFKNNVDLKFSILFSLIIFSCFLLEFLAFKFNFSLKLIFDSNVIICGIITLLIFLQNYL